MRQLTLIAIRPLLRPALLLAAAGLATLSGQALAAEALGPIEFGRFSVFLQAIAILATVAVFGYDNALVRHISTARGENRSGAVANLVAAANSATLPISVGVAVAACAGFLLIEDFGLSLALILSLAVAIPATVRMRITSARLRALGGANLAIAVERLVRDAPLFIVCVAFIAISTELRLGAAQAAIAVICGIAGGLYMAQLRAPARSRRGDHQVPAEFHGSARRFTAFAIADALFQRIDIFVVSMVLSERFAGLLGIALIIAGLCGFGAILSVYIYVPRIGAAFSAGRPGEAERLLRSSAFVAMAATLSVLVLWAGYTTLLSDFALREYAEAEDVVALMIAAQLINATTGSTGPALGVIGFERDLVKVYVGAVIFRVVLTVALIDIFGFVGIGFSLVLCYAVVNAGLGFVLWHRARLLPGIFSLLRARP